MSWAPDPTRALLPRERYLFVVAAAASGTEESVFSLLERQGWQVVSMGAAPSELATELRELAAKTGTEIHAWRVIAIWAREAPSTLPASKDSLFFGSIMKWVKDAPETTESEPSNVWPYVLGSTALAILIALAWRASRARILRTARSA